MTNPSDASTSTASADQPSTERPTVTARELTEWLRTAGVLDSASSVATVESARIGEGIGFVGRLDRLALGYDGEAPGAPRSVILKRASDTDGIREMVANSGAYDHEVRFYNELAADSDILTPACFFADSDGASGIRIVLEDIGDDASLDQVAGATREQALRAVKDLARFHAGWWQSERLLSIDWLQLTEGVARKAVDAFREALPRFREEFGAEYPKLDRWARRLLFLIDVDADLTRIPKRFTLVHGDFRLDNILVPPGQPEQPVYADWHGVSIASGARDLVRFMAISMETELRREMHDELLGLYHDTLVKHGVEGYSTRNLGMDHNLGFVHEFAFAVVVHGVSVDLRQNLGDREERWEALEKVIISRLNAALEDQKIGRLLWAAGWLSRFRRLGRRIRGLVTFSRRKQT